MLVAFSCSLISISSVSTTIGWFLATESNDLLALIPVPIIWIHHTLGVLSFVLFSHLPVMVASDLLSTFLINSLANHFRTWSEMLQMEASDEDYDDGVRIRLHRFWKLEF